MRANLNLSFTSIQYLLLLLNSFFIIHLSLIVLYSKLVSVKPSNVLHSFSVLSLQILPQNLPKLIKVLLLRLFKHWVLDVAINSTLQAFEEVKIHLELIHTLELYSKSCESTFYLILIKLYRILLYRELANSLDWIIKINITWNPICQ